MSQKTAYFIHASSLYNLPSKNLGAYPPEDCPESPRAASEVLAMPIYPALSETQRRHVVGTIAAFDRVDP